MHNFKDQHQQQKALGITRNTEVMLRASPNIIATCVNEAKFPNKLPISLQLIQN